MQIQRISAARGKEFLRLDQSWTSDGSEAFNFSDKFAYEFVDKAIDRGELNIYFVEDEKLEQW